MKKKLSLLLVLMLSFTMVCGSMVTVNAASKPTKMTFKASSTTLYVGTTVQISVKSVKPAKASKAVTYKTSNKKVAAVSSKGVVTGKKAGTAKITVTSKKNKKLKKTFKVTVKNPAKEIIEEISGVSFPNDFEITNDHPDGFLFVQSGTIKKYFFNKTDHTMIIFDNMKFGSGAVLRIENEHKLGMEEVGVMPKFSGGVTFECEGCGSCTAFADASFNGMPYACDKSSVTGGYYDDMNHEPIAEPEQVDAIEIVQYWDGAEYKILVNGLVHIEG